MSVLFSVKCAIFAHLYIRQILIFYFKIIEQCFVVILCRQAGVVMTGAGATWPYGLDPNDSNIRIAPTFPSLNDLQSAIKVFTLCVRISSAKKILADRKEAA